MQVINDIFPAVVTVHPSPEEPPFKIINARIVISNTRLIVATDQPEGPMVVYTEDIDAADLVRIERNQYEIEATSGRKISWIKDSSCGCGSRLRTWRPFGYLTSTAEGTGDPT